MRTSTRTHRPMAKNGNELKIAVLAEQLKQIGDGLAAHRQDTKEFRDDMRRDLHSLREEVISRADRHESNDQANFKAIDDRMVLNETATATREAARDAVTKYKKWQWTLISAAVVTILWNLLKVAEPVIHRILSQ